MELKIRPMSYEERKYSYNQSSQLDGQTACIGRLRGDFGSSGAEFWTTWEDSVKKWKTDEFKAEIDDVINALRSEKYGMLKDRCSMVSFARKEPDSAFKGNYTTEYGFRVDTKEHACGKTHKGESFFARFTMRSSTRHDPESMMAAISHLVV